jgi:hypothetical protein
LRDPDIHDLIQLHRRLAGSTNPVQRGAGTLLITGMLSRHLVALNDKSIGRLIFDVVLERLSIISPEYVICQHTSERLLGPARTTQEEKWG